MHYHQPSNPQQTLATVDRLCHHHDHLKALVREYAMMRDKETYGRMHDPSFCTDVAAMQRVDSRNWLRTSLILPLTASPIQSLLANANYVYAKIVALVHRYYPTYAVDSTCTSAHITIKTLAGDVEQSRNDLLGYAVHIRPIVHQWLAAMQQETQLYAVGLFCSLSAERGLSLGLRFLPSLPLLQIIRGEVGVALYQQPGGLPLRTETAFHTTLTHSTNLRIRLHDFPLQRAFINDFQQLVERYDRHCFGILNALTPADFVIRHGYSDQLIPLVDVSCA